MIKLNCAAIPKDLVESELFGHEKGAFTGALARKLGRFELAHQGTLFLDEVGELPLDLQPKLLRVLQDGEFERVGGTETHKVDVRIVAATNRDLARRAQEGRFRADLYYRLNVFPIALPRLHHRKEDLPPLIEHFVRRYADKYGKRIESVPARVMSALQAHDWRAGAAACAGARCDPHPRPTTLCTWTSRSHNTWPRPCARPSASRSSPPPTRRRSWLRSSRSTLGARPGADQRHISLFFEASPDSTLAATNRDHLQVVDALTSFPETEFTWSLTSAWGGFGGLVAKDWRERTRSTEEMYGDVYAAVSQVSGLRVFPRLDPPLPTPGQIDLPEARVVLDRERIADLGLDLAGVGRELGTLLGGDYVNRFNFFDRSY